MSREMEHRNKFNLTIQTPSEEDENNTPSKDHQVIIERPRSAKKRRGTHDLASESISERLQYLLLDDFVEMSADRLRVLLSSMESGMRGDDTLMSEDVIEFTAYLASEDEQLYQEAMDQFCERFDDKFECISEIGQLCRPQVGDLLIDALSDLVIAFCEEVPIREERCQSMLHLIAITSKTCVLRHGLTRLLEMYRWSITTAPVLAFKDSSKTTKPNSPKEAMIRPSVFRQSLAIRFLDILTECVQMEGPDVFLSSYLDHSTPTTSMPSPAARSKSQNDIQPIKSQKGHNHSTSRSGLYPMVHIKSRLQRGWSFTSWIRLSRQQQDGIFNVLSFEGLLRISIHCRMNVPHSITCSLTVESMEFGSSSSTGGILRGSGSNGQKVVVLPDLNLSPGRWHFICLSHHMSSKTDNFVVFIDGIPVEQRLSVPYPHFGNSNNNGIFPMHIGGFIGDLGQSFVYEASLNALTVSALHCVGPTYCPPIYNRMSSGATGSGMSSSGMMSGTSHFDRIAAFPWSVRQRAAPMQPRKYGYLLLPFCYALNPRAVSEVLCLPTGWGFIDICDRKNGVKVVSVPHNKSSLISLGGICYLFYWLSPEFNGPSIFTEQQAANVLQLLNELMMSNQTLLRQLFTMGLSAVKIYILKFIKSQHRTHLVLNRIKELLMIVTNCDGDQRKQYFVDGFVHLVLDANYWIRAPKEVQTMLASYIHTLIETQPKTMAHCLTLQDLFDIIRAFFPNSFVKRQPSFNVNDSTNSNNGNGSNNDHRIGLPLRARFSNKDSDRPISIDDTASPLPSGFLPMSPNPFSPNKVPPDADDRVALKLLESAAALVRLRPSTIKYAAHRAISLLVDQCTSKPLRCHILSTYAEMCHHAPDILFAQMSSKYGFIKVLWDILQEKEESAHSSFAMTTEENKVWTDSRVKAAKILMGFMRYQKKVFSTMGSPTPVVVVSRSGHVNKSALDELIHQIGLSLGALSPSLASYSSLLEMVLGKFKLNMTNHTMGLTYYITQKLPPEDEDGTISGPQGRTPTVEEAAAMILLVSHEDQISCVGALEGLMNLISVSSYRMRTRMLMDILSLVKTSDYNQKLFCRQRNEWDKWMVSLLAVDPNDDDAGACNQLVSQIAATIVWRFLIKDDKGWISVMQLLESVNRKILSLIKKEKRRFRKLSADEMEQKDKSKENEDTETTEGLSDHNNNNNDNKDNKSKPALNQNSTSNQPPMIPPSPNLSPQGKKSHPLTMETKLKCRVLHEFLVQVLVLVLNRFLMDQLRADHDPIHRNQKGGKSNGNGFNMNDLSDTSEGIKNRTSKNLISILDITEWVLFNHRFSMLAISRIKLRSDAKETDITVDMLFETRDAQSQYEPEMVRNEILLLKRLLSCSLKFISFKNERQLVLRRLLRYLKEILPHKACHQVFEDCLNAAREFCHRVQSGTKPHRKGHKISMKSENNMKTMRIAYSFLKNAHIRFQRRGEMESANTVRALQQSVYSFWGPQLFEDKIDPNTANQPLPLSKAEEILENEKHHIHSLWVFLQHQKWWEFQFQDKNMKKFKMEYTNHEKEEKKKAMTNQDQFDKYYLQCAHNYRVLSAAEMQRLNDSLNAKRKQRRNVARDLKKYMDFFDEDFQCRFPNENTPDFWELDPRESSSNHTRLLLVRNFKGTDHSPAAVELTQNTRKRKGSRAARKGSQSNRSSPSMEAKVAPSNDGGNEAIVLRQISHGIMKEMSLDDAPSMTTELETHISIDSIPEEKESTPKQEEGATIGNGVEDDVSADAVGDDDEGDIIDTFDPDDDEQGFEIEEEDDDEEDDGEEEKYQTFNLSGKKILLELEATSISPFFKIEGKMYFTEHHLIFEGHEYLENVHEQVAKDQIKLTQQRFHREKKTLLKGARDSELIRQLESDNKEQEERILAAADFTMKDIIEYEIWSLAHIKHLYPRRYLLRENALEIWIAGTSKSFFFTFANTKRRGEVIATICKNSPRFIKNNASASLLANPVKMLKHLALTEKWQKRKISNFDYLMELNVLAGRSYNDITQYPVFPWVITDFTSESIDLSDLSIYRDLTKPIGALNPDRLATFAQRYNDSKLDVSDGFPPFYYGSHYMSAGIALYYLCRMEPFATLYINLHGGRFEIPDRTFYSVTNAWELSLNNMGDVKELIPEAFYFPEFLRNLNRFPLGCRANQTEIDNVGLPPWANGSPEEFVRTMREALESDYVSNHLHHWIDLIFGYKQRGAEAEKSHNVFFYLTYAGAVDYDKITDATTKRATEQQIYHFGQTPNILFHQPHPARMSKERCPWLCELVLPLEMDTVLDMVEDSLPSTPLEEAMNINDGGGVDEQEQNWMNSKPSVMFRNKPFVICEFKPNQMPSTLHIIRSGQILKIFDATERILTFELPMLCYLDPSQPAKSTQLRNIIDASSTQIPPDSPIFELMPPDWSDSIVYSTFVISQNGLYGITAGYLDCSIKVHWLKDGSTLASVTGLENGHNDMITCLALDHSTQDMVISGGKDGSIVHWSAMLKMDKPGRSPLIGKPYRLLSIHHDAVRVIAVNSNVGIIVSAADDGTIALYSIARKRFVRELLFEGRVDDDMWDDMEPTYNGYGSNNGYHHKSGGGGGNGDDGVLREVLLITISDSGYIVIHSLDQSIPYLRVLSINGILIKKVKIDEILFSLKTDSTGKILITGGVGCKVVFRHIHSLEVIQEIMIMENQQMERKKLYKKPNKSKRITASAVEEAIFGPHSNASQLVTHCSAWRQQRFSFKRKKSKKEQRKRVSLSHNKESRKIPNFRGRFHSVDGDAILSQSRIVDFDLDPDNTYLMVTVLNMNPKQSAEEHRAQLLLYPLPNSRHLHHFDKFVHGSNKVLQTAKTTIWENIIDVIESDEKDHASVVSPYSMFSGVPDLYLSNSSTHLSSSGSTKNLFAETGKTLISKFKKTTNKIGKELERSLVPTDDTTNSQNSSNDHHGQSNGSHSANDGKSNGTKGSGKGVKGSGSGNAEDNVETDHSSNVLKSKLNALTSLWSRK